MKIHFIAIGGSAMHNLAIALHIKGYHVSGSDDSIFEPSKSRLIHHGLFPKEIGWNSSNISDDLDCVILGMHAKKDNPELIEAQKKSIKIFSYPEFIYEMSKNKTRVVIGGSHGKTSITAMILHVLNDNDISVDYMVGAQLKGFSTMVHLTDENDFILLEGDEYLSSPIDRRPKFHLYKPNIALLSGIAWDHINVFPTKEIYSKQFEIFLDSIVSGGSIVYNELDLELNQMVQNCSNSIRKLEYSLPEFLIENDITYLITDEGRLPLKIFGDHNLSNLSGAKLICQLMGVQEEEFNSSIVSFGGADKRLESLLEMNDRAFFKDFAHSPSKVSATTNALKIQYKNRKLIALLELHTFSSLNEDFIGEYRNSLKQADTRILFYDPKAVESKGLKNISVQKIKDSFNDDNMIVFSNSDQLKSYLFELSYVNTNLLFMSSGNYASIDLEVLNDFIKNN
ncbi:Mur ligase domain-containing protein [Flavobacteriaceae bacterium]|nr:Mur ligase domain-containing protein [Flavobacteriaceae bacterium]